MDEVKLYFIIDQTPFVKIVNNTGIKYLRVEAAEDAVIERALDHADRILFLDSMEGRMWVDQATAYDLARDPEYFSPKAH